MPKSRFTLETHDKVVDGRLHSPVQDTVGNDWTSIAPLVMTAGVQYPFTCNGAIRNFENFPDHITRLWDTVNNLVVLDELLDTPVMVVEPSLVISPNAAAEGIFTFKAWVNEDTPIEIESTNVTFKGITERITGLVTFYTGAETGFDIKNKGVFFTIESNKDVSVYTPAIKPYRT